ncbi:glutathione peroxidase [Virgibacillus sp. LDC1]|jgi:glutathione peroxidase|uniref:glutathione peroxidase n=1 Tax=Bacillales TaxID=1385 RepID=UPI0001789079|nr:MULTISPECIES: glutathione peroxidase [Paenibacillus]MBY0165122.1 glutathione peroxidase [Cytobacillus firmus]MCV4235294.1 glutathione peroxidase [Virgibacillus sp. LDC1]VTR18512.1 Glutathione peroxidase homolog BsaA [Actinobacillus pleuropneumoniae]ACX68266.1 Peroxiredoxin [Paenibacillus sp. Y412MC10]EGG35091.1 peroxiredoxin HYR1 [Paenibacillus sp. HGF5]
MSIYEYEVKTIRGESQTLESYKGDVMLIVNTATKCGFAPQFDGLEKLHQTYRDQGLAVLGFPSSQFMNQELEEDAAIEEACKLNHGVTFPLFSKIDVNGTNAHPLYKYLTSEAPGALGIKAIKWNFTKFLVDRSGKVIKRFAPTDTPEKMEEDIKKLL